MRGSASIVDRERDHHPLVLVLEVVAGFLESFPKALERNIADMLPWHAFVAALTTWAATIVNNIELDPANCLQP